MYTSTGSGDFPGVSTEELKPRGIARFCDFLGLGMGTLPYTSEFLEVCAVIPQDIARNQANNSSKTTGPVN